MSYFLTSSGSVIATFCLSTSTLFLSVLCLYMTKKFIILQQSIFNYKNDIYSVCKEINLNLEKGKNSTFDTFEILESYQKQQLKEIFTIQADIFRLSDSVKKIENKKEKDQQMQDEKKPIKKKRELTKEQKEKIAEYMREYHKRKKAEKLQAMPKASDLFG